MRHCITLAVCALLAVAVTGKQQRHPITGSLPPPGARCAAHAKQDSYWNATVNITDPEGPKLYKNESLVPIDWADWAEGCPAMADMEWACCSESQYRNMVSHEKLLTTVMRGCPACKESLRSLFCWYTCGPYQYYTNQATAMINETGEVLTTSFAVTEELSSRIWAACENAILGANTMKDTWKQSKVLGLYNMIVSFSPMRMVNGTEYRILGDVRNEPTCSKNALNWNTTTYECNFSCSNPDYPTTCPTKHRPKGCGGYNIANVVEKKAHFPLPEAKVGSLPLHHFVAILLAILLGMVGLVGFLNRDTHHLEGTCDPSNSDNSDETRSNTSDASPGKIMRTHRSESCTSDATMNTVERGPDSQNRLNDGN